MLEMRTGHRIVGFIQQRKWLFGAGLFLKLPTAQTKCIFNKAIAAENLKLLSEVFLFGMD
jgi:hypothetical protein